MAGGTSGKSGALLMVAIAKCSAAIKELQLIQQGGAPTTAQGNARHAVADPIIVAAIAALQAVQ